MSRSSPPFFVPDTAPARARRGWERAVALYVVDLGCGHCGRRAEAVLRALPGVAAATVRRLQERADVRYDLRRTSEKELTSALAGAGFRVAVARRSAGPRTGPGGLEVAIALVALANLLLIDAATGPGAQGSAVGLARIVLAALALAACASALAAPALSLARRGILDGDALSLVGALGSFLAGMVQLGLAGVHGRPPSALDTLGLRPEAWEGQRWGFVAAAGIAAAALLARFAQAGLRRAALRGLSDDDRCTLVRRLDARNGEHTAHADTLTIGDRVRLFQGERAPAGLHLEGAARSTAPGVHAAGELLPAGAVLLSGEATGRVESGHSSLSAALDAELRAVLAHLAGTERCPAPDSWDDAAVRGVITSALGCASFALVTHGCLGTGPLGPMALSAAVAVLVVASPAAFLATGPAARAIAVLRARAAGVVVKDAAALEALAAVDVMCLETSGGVTHEALARSDAAAAVHALRARGVRAVLTSGDPTAAMVPAARLLRAPGSGAQGPAERALAIRDLQLGGARVLLVGDGWNDPHVAAQADVDVAIAPGTLPRAVRAPIVICRDRLDELPGLVDLGRALRAVVRRSAALSAVFNGALIPAAALGYVSPLTAAGLVLLETLLGLADAARLLRRPAISSTTA